MTISDLLQTGVRGIMALPSMREMAHRGGVGRERFMKLAPQFEARYRTIEKGVPDILVTSAWETFNRDVERALLPSPSFGFLQQRTVARTMFSLFSHERAKADILHLEQKYAFGELQRLLVENATGKPLLLNTKYQTSYNSIHLLEHIAMYEECIGYSLAHARTIVEWGGGYGRMAVLFDRLQTSPATYVIIDTPLFSTVQWLYLSSVLGEDRVVLGGEKIEEEKITLVPLSQFEKMHGITADVFISTWALSESTKAAIEEVTSRRWFHAPHVLLAYQYGDSVFTDADFLEEKAKEAGCIIKEVPLAPGNRYAFR